MRFIGLIALACFALQAVALGKAGVAGNQYCVVAPIPDCEAAIWAGYRVLLEGAGKDMNLAGVLARFVPLFLWFSVVLSLHAPRLTMKRGGSTKISPGGYIYGVVFVAIAGYSAMNMSSAAPSAPSAPSTSAAPSSGAAPSGATRASPKGP